MAKPSKKAGVSRISSGIVTSARKSAALRSVEGGSATAHGAIRLERRRENRELVRASRGDSAMSATYSDGGTRFGITTVEIVDQSRSGLGVRSTTLIEPGMIVTICPPGSRIPWLSARAVRCQPESDGEHYRVGLSLGARRAA
jgi:hypothetical protein